VSTSPRAHWFSRPPERAVSGARSQVVAPSLPGAPRPAPSLFAIQVNLGQSSDHLVIRLKGEARVEYAGALTDGLLSHVSRRPALVTLDLSELRSISSLAMGVLAGFCRGVIRACGRVCLAEGLQPAVREALTRAELTALFEPTAAAPALAK
jgi:anti-anti-sigma factor